MNDLERLYVAQALQKQIGDYVSTKNPQSLRSIMDDQMRDLYETEGIKSRDAMVNGEKVGTYSVKTTKGTKDKVEQVPEVFDADAMLEWAKDNPEEFMEWFRKDGAHALAVYCFQTYGEVPDGCRMREEVKPGKPAGYNGTTLRVDPVKVASALHGQLPGMVNGLLMGDVQ